MPLSDGLITTRGPSCKASTTAAKKPPGTSSPMGAGADASLERPRPAGIQVWEKKTRAVSGKTGPFLQEDLLGQALHALVPITHPGPCLYLQHLDLSSLGQTQSISLHFCPSSPELSILKNQALSRAKSLFSIHYVTLAKSAQSSLGCSVSPSLTRG